MRTNRNISKVVVRNKTGNDKIFTRYSSKLRKLMKELGVSNRLLREEFAYFNRVADGSELEFASQPDTFFLPDRRREHDTVSAPASIPRWARRPSLRPRRLALLFPPMEYLPCPPCLRSGTACALRPVIAIPDTNREMLE